MESTASDCSEELPSRISNRPIAVKMSVSPGPIMAVERIARLITSRSRVSDWPRSLSQKINRVEIKARQKAGSPKMIQAEAVCRNVQDIMTVLNSRTA